MTLGATPSKEGISFLPVEKDSLLELWPLGVIGSLIDQTSYLNEMKVGGVLRALIMPEKKAIGLHE